MTYCVGLKLDRGLLFMSDSRTNSGIDNISVYRKIRTWEVPGERVISLMCAGNLATTQTLISVLDERTELPSDRDPDILSERTMFQVARLVGDTLHQVIEENRSGAQKGNGGFRATLILGGQIAGMEPRLFLVYPEGNFIETGPDAPFFQLGETKYGRPILLRGYDPQMSFEDAMRLLTVSFDSTMKANLSVGMPLDYHVYEADSLRRGIEGRIQHDDEYFNSVSRSWGLALKDAVQSLPPYSFPAADPSA